MPELEEEPVLRTKSDLAIALISNYILILSAELKGLDSKAGIRLNVLEKNGFVDLEFTSADLSKESAQKLFNQINLLIGKDQPSILLIEKSNGITISFKTVTTLY